MTSGQETEQVYSFNPAARMGPAVKPGPLAMSQTGIVVLLWGFLEWVFTVSVLHRLTFSFCFTGLFLLILFQLGQGPREAIQRRSSGTAEAGFFHRIDVLPVDQPTVSKH